MQNSHSLKSINPVDVVRLFIAPVGAFFTLVGFCVPWAAVTVFILGTTYVSGYQMGIYLWLLPMLCLAIVGGSFVSIFVKNPWVARILVAGLAAFGLLLVFIRAGFLVYEIFNTPGMQVSFHIGIPITLFGLFIAFAGGLLLPSFHKVKG